jgi:hypothetical protein
MVHEVSRIDGEWSSKHDGIMTGEPVQIASFVKGRTTTKRQMQFSGRKQPITEVPNEMADVTFFTGKRLKYIVST